MDCSLDTIKENLKSYLDYNPSTGVFHWKVKKSNAITVGMVAGTKNHQGYIKIAFNRKCYCAHRLAWLYTYGVWPTGQIDHINGNKSDNRITNLRDVTKGENMRNMPKQTSNTSGKVGVDFSVQHSKWTVRIAVDGVRMYLGRYEDFNEACAVRDNAEKVYGFHKNHGRDGANHSQHKGDIS